MGTIRTILHPTALAPGDRDAARLAGALARTHNARLVVLHAMSPWYYQGRAEMLAQFLEQKLERWEALRRYRIDESGLPRELRLVEGEPVASILRAARELPADLIVMSRVEQTRLNRWLGESITDAVLRMAPCPVLTATTHAGAQPRDRKTRHSIAAARREESPASRPWASVRTPVRRSGSAGRTQRLRLARDRRHPVV